MLKKAIDKIKEQLNNKTIVLACSTGIDSMVLLNLLLNYTKNSKIIISHINHQKRTQSTLEEEYIKKYCLEKGLKCYVKVLPHYEESNFQEWARDQRYQFFDEIMEKENADYLITAHHADDNLETIIMRLLKSSSLKGYAGIEELTKKENYYIFRPLLENSKKEIMEYAVKNNIFYYQDDSNYSDDYTRNRIRKYITPILLEENPNLYEAISYYNKTILSANELLEKEKVSFIKNHVLVKNNNNEILIQFKIDEYLKLTEYLQVQILFRILRKFNLSKTCIDDIIKQIKSDKNKIISKINLELTMIKEYGYIQFVNFDISEKTFYLEITEAGTYDLLDNNKLIVNKNCCYFNTNKGNLWYNIKGLPIIIRTRKNGDKIKTKVGTISVSDYLTNKKVPSLERRNILLLCENDIVTAILGYVIKH